MAKHKPKKPRHRNNATGGAPPRPPAARTSRGSPRRAEPPDLWTTVAAVAGGAGSALLSGLIVNQDILTPEAAAIGLIAGGGATAFLAEGNTRVVGNSVASAGAGQLALALMGRRAMARKTAPPAAQVAQAAPAPVPQLAPPVPARPANSPHGGGYVLDVFRDAASQLDVLDDDEWRLGIRDAGDAGEVYDLDDQAAAA